MNATKLAAAVRMMLPLLADVEWEDDLDQTACPTGFVDCRWCEGGGRFNEGGSPSKRCPPRHREDCPYVAAIETAKEALQ